TTGRESASATGRPRKCSMKPGVVHLQIESTPQPGPEDVVASTFSVHKLIKKRSRKNCRRAFLSLWILKTPSL
ncbi:hypothetical protein, partial [Geothermobacter ehrlichii]|uniref:hypothetical protein n=1 Tax=Geothermobacter ehrlichii TaxID=213224 RepID=UPI001CA319B1